MVVQQSACDHIMMAALLRFYHSEALIIEEVAVSEDLE